MPTEGFLFLSAVTYCEMRFPNRDSGDAVERARGPEPVGCEGKPSWCFAVRTQTSSQKGRNRISPSRRSDCLHPGRTWSLGVRAAHCVIGHRSHAEVNKHAEILLVTQFCALVLMVIADRFGAVILSSAMEGAVTGEQDHDMLSICSAARADAVCVLTR